MRDAEHFWYFNNGITVVCNAARKTAEHGTAVLRVSNPQVINGQQTLMRKFDSITAETSKRLTLGEPRCLVVSGHSDELTDQPMRENFELQRERIHGVTIITYDELFIRLQRLVSLLEGPQ